MIKSNTISNPLPLVSVVMPNYNNIKYLPQAIDSILNQTYRNIELIIVDGKSTDGSIQLIEDYIARDDRVKLFFDNGDGVGAATIIGCNEAQGDYIARMDSDDISNPKRIEIEVNFLANNPEYVLVSSANDYIDEKGHVFGRSFPFINEEAIIQGLLRFSTISQPMAMFRKSAYDKSGGYLPLMFVEDRVFWNRLAKIGKMKNLPCVLGQYRILNDSLSHTFNPYEEVLYAFRNKMCKDDSILSSDIELYNNICRYSKQFRVPSTVSTKKHQESLQYRAFIILRLFIGTSCAERLMCYLSYIRYRRLLTNFRLTL